MKQTQADADGAFTAFRETLEARVGNVEDVNSTQAIQIADRYTRAQADSAISTAVSSATATLTNQIGQRATATSVSALTSRVSNTENGLSALSDTVTQVSVTTNEASAYGRMRVTAWGTGADAGARIGISARASIGEQHGEAALFIEAVTNGSGRVSVVADRFAIVTGTGVGAARSVPFYVQGGASYIDMAVIRDADITGAKIANLTVDTINIKDAAVTQVRSNANNAGLSTDNTSTWVNVVSLTWNSAKAGVHLQTVRLRSPPNSGGAGTIYWRWLRPLVL